MITKEKKMTTDIAEINMTLAEVLSARFCHDLSGPIGAINNGAEFLKEEEFDMTEQAIQLIDMSAKEAVARLQFFREIYGSPAAMGEANLAQLKEHTLLFFQQTKVDIDWPDQHTDAAEFKVSHRMAKLLLNMILTASQVLIRGGSVSVRLQRTDKGRRITVVSSGEQIKLNDETIHFLTKGQECPEITKQNVQTYITARLMHELDVQLALQYNDKQVRCELNYAREKF
jgi:histidine phosphotransferase ChpT